MAMNFYQANMAQPPDLASAEATQAGLDQQRANAKQLRNQQMMTGLGQGVMGLNDLGMLEGVKAELAGLGGAGTAAAVPASAGQAAGLGAMLHGPGAVAPAAELATGAAAPALFSNPVGWGALAALGLGSILLR